MFDQNLTYFPNNDIALWEAKLCMFEQLLLLFFLASYVKKKIILKQSIESFVCIGLFQHFLKRWIIIIYM